MTCRLTGWQPAGSWRDPADHPKIAHPLDVAEGPEPVQKSVPREPLPFRLLRRLPVDQSVRVSDRVSDGVSIHLSNRVPNRVSDRVSVRYLTAVRVAVHVVVHGRSTGCTAVKATHHGRRRRTVEGGR